MLIRIWACLMFICIAARSEKYDTVEGIATAEKREASRKVRHLQLKFQAARELEKIESDSLIRDMKMFEYHVWLSETQKQLLREMELEGKSKFEIRDKILEFFAKLPAAEKAKWNEYYKKQCFEWVEMVANKAELEELEALRSKKTIHDYMTKLNEYKNRLPKEKQMQVDLWQNACDELLGLNVNQKADRQEQQDSNNYASIHANQQVPFLEDMKADKVNDKDIGRKKDNQLNFDALIDEYFNRLSKGRQENSQPFKEKCREIWKETMVLNRPKHSVDENGHVWLSWMTDDQMNELIKLCGNSTFREIHKLAEEYFSQLSEMKQKQPVNDLKEKCQKYFLAMANEDEITKMNVAYSKMDHIQYKKIVDEIFHRQQNVPNKADQFYKICNDAYHKQIDRSKRDVDALIEKHLNWLSPSQKAEIKQMKDNGESLTAIKHKLLGYIKDLGEKERQYYTEKTRQSCYSWLDEVTTTGERAELEKLHQTNHSVCKKKIREYIKRLSLEKQEAVNRDLEVCEHIWYQEHERHNEEGHEHHHHHHRGHRKIRLVNPSERYDNDKEENQQTRTQRHDETEDGRRTENIENQMPWLSTEQIRQLEKFRKMHPTLAINQLVKFIETKDSKTQRSALRILARHCRQARYLPDDETAEDIEHVLKFTLGTQYGKILHKTESDDLGMEHNDGFNKRICGKIHRLLRVNGRIKRDHTHSHTTGEQQQHQRHHHHHHSLEHYFSTHLKWLSDEQKAKIKKMKEDGESRSTIQHKILEYYESLAEGDKKEDAKEQLKDGCRELLSHIIGEEKTNELKKMKDIKTVDEINEKIEELVAQIDNEKKKEQFRIYAPTCRKVYGVKAGARFRRHHHHTLEDYFGTYLNWLTSRQKEELNKMKKEGKSKTIMQQKIMEYYDALSKEARKKVSNQLEGGCRELLKEVIGEDKLREVKEMRDSGAKWDKIEAKVDKLLSEVTDKMKKEKIEEYGPICRKIYEDVITQSEQETGKHSLEHYMEKYLQWLNDEQKDEIRKMKKEGKSTLEMQEKVFDYYKKLEGEKKEKAEEQLKAGCKDMYTLMIGEEKMNELKKMKDGGATLQEVSDKLDEMLSAITESSKLGQIKKYRPICRKLFGLEDKALEKRDEHSKHELESYFEENLKWLSTEQKNELRKMKQDGKTRAELSAKVFHYYNELSGEAKDHVTETLRGSCQQILKKVIGEEHYEELKKLKDSGASMDELKAKADTMLSKITDGKMKEMIELYGDGCREILTQVHQARSLEEYFKGYLKWLTEEQKKEVQKMKDESKPKADIMNKILHFYENLSGETKEEANKFMSSACQGFIKYIVGDEKAAELKKLRDSGVSMEKMKSRIEAMFEEVKDEHKKKKIEEYGPSCRKFLMDHYLKHDQHTLEHYFKTHLKWLSEKQKQEIKEMKHSNKTITEIQEKIFGYLDYLEGDAKCHAVDLMYQGCREFLHQILGDEKYEEVKKMKESGATYEELMKKVETLLEEVKDEKKKEKITRYMSGCKKVFAMVNEHKNHTHDDLEYYLEGYLNWLSEKQKTEVKEMMNEKKSKAEITDKIFNFYKELKGDEKDNVTDMLKEPCQELYVDTIGEAKFAEFKALLETTSEVKEVMNKVNELLEGAKDEEKKKRYKDYKSLCYKVGENWYIKHHGEMTRRTPEDYFKKDLSWLTDEQKDELRQMRKEGKLLSEREDKVIEFLEKLDHEKKENAVALIQAGCRVVLKKVLGEESMAELKKMRDSGVSLEVLMKKIDSLLEAVTDERKKEKAKEFGKPCRKVFTLAFEFGEHKPENRTLEQYLQHELKWLTEEEKKELRNMKNENKTRKELLDKVMHFYQKAEGSTKEEATRILKKSCNDFMLNLLGEEKAKDLKEMMDSGKSFEEISEKFKEYKEKITDEHKKAHLDLYEPGCKDVYKYAIEHKKEQTAFARFKRHVSMQNPTDDEASKHNLKRSIDHHLENYFATHLKWLSAKQQEELRNMKAAGKDRAEIQSKIFEFFTRASGETKTEATRSLQEGCHQLFKDIVGEQKAHELDVMVQSDVASEKLEKKIDELIASVGNEAERTQARISAETCKHLYGIRAA